jgi:hypothetical protein
MILKASAAALAAGLALVCPARADEMKDVRAFFSNAVEAGRAGLARKTRLVDAREAKPGEVIVTIIRGEGTETESPPARAGDMVVRNRCTQTGNEEFLVSAKKFPLRYQKAAGPEDAGGWRPYRPRGTPMRFAVVTEAEGAFTFMAPWGEPMVARPGDAIVQNPGDPKDTYRVQKDAFACTYEAIQKPHK